MAYSTQISFRNTMPLNEPAYAAGWIKSVRKARGMTQSELAAKANVTQRLVSEFESGKVMVRIDTLFRLVQALGLRLAVIDPSIEIPDDEKEDFEW